MSLVKSPGLRRCWLAALAYIAITWVSVWLLRHVLADADAWLRAAVALVPVVPIVFAVRAVVQLILAGDELQQRIDLEAIAMASALVGLGTLTLSLLMVADVIQLSGRQAMLWVLPALWITYGVTKVWAARRYR